MTVLQAFSDDMAAKLTGLTVGQLRRWDTDGFYTPELAADNRRLPYSRVYSFRDIVSLRVIAALRNDHGVSLQHLKKAAARLRELGDDAWSTTTLYVLEKRIVFEKPDGPGLEEIVSRQGVFEIPLRVVSKSVEKDVETLFQRSEASIGKVSQERFVMGGEPVVSGTRIPVRTVQAYLEMGLSDSRILSDYPDLTSRDVDTIRKLKGNSAA